jgi:DNA adenine methylase
MSDLCLELQSSLDNLANIRARLMRVQIDNRDAIQCLKYWDSKETVFYIDPPYEHGTRKDNNAYGANEMNGEYHVRLVDAILAIEGRAAVSGYDCENYRRLETDGWKRHDLETACHSSGKTRGTRNTTKEARKRIEVVWVKE